MGRIVWFGGEFVAAENGAEGPRVSIFDRGYQLGAGVFATMRAYEGRCFRAATHLAQLAYGAAALGLGAPRADVADLVKLAAIADEAAKRTGESNARVRVTVTDTATSIVAEPMTLPSADDYAHGIAAAIVTPRRIPPACFDGTIKATSYAAQLIARRQAEARGAAEGIQLAIDGTLACGTMANLFLVRGDTLATPSLESGCRAGVTRAEVLTLAPLVGLAAREARLEPADLLTADEAFFTNSRVECLPIASVDGRAIGRADGTRPRTQALLEAFRRRVRDATGAS